MDRLWPPRTTTAWIAVLLAVAGIWFFVFRGKPPDRDGPSGGRDKRAARRPATGPELYATHCAACHGDKGEGNGPAARFLYPKPRDFTETLFRLVTTGNNIPSDEDLRRVIRQGMPGSAMLAFGHLPQGEIDLLVGEVRQRIRDGLAGRLKRETAEQGETLDADELAGKLDTLTKPGDPVPTPAKLPEANAESVARGAALYRDVKTGCAACHGEKGKGDGAQEQKNNDGTPTRPRDFTRGIFKSGRDARQLYVRIVRGMPGTPMPASGALTEQQMGDLVNFILSLSPPGATEKVEHRRRQLIARRVERLPDTPDASAWGEATEVPIVVAPLWWRDDADADLRVSSLHDGTTLAVRLTWRDSAPSRGTMRPEDFEDLAAVQLFKGDREPFVGMGAMDSAIELWLWRAGREPGGGELDHYPFDSPEYKSVVRGKEVPDFLTARAAGNPTAARSNGATASHLVARGFGSTTFRPRQSQLVQTEARWKHGQWTVVLRRPLAVAKGEGVALGAGEKCSIAFAIWYGEAKDRNGQKLVSVWHDWTIE